MLGATPRQRMLAIGSLLLAAATGASALLRRLDLALVGVSALLVLVVLLLMDARARVAGAQRQLRAAARRARRAGAERGGGGPRPEAAVAELHRELAQIRKQLVDEQHLTARLDDLATASFRQSIRQHVRIFRAEDKLLRPKISSALQLPFKLRNLELAASHGVAVPQVYRVWPDLDSLDLEGLPDTFVLKADGGAGSVAVLPLRRRGDGRYDIIGGKGNHDEDELKEKFRSLERNARPPYFAEELLHGADGGPIPPDVKCYMFYGEVGQVLVRRVGEHGRASTIRLKFIDEHGKDFGPVAVGRKHDPSIEVPRSLPEIVEVARHLSRAVGLPFCRVDLYETSRGIVLGEITRAPSGGNERFLDEHDELLGRRWIDGSARLTADLVAGRPYGPLFGAVADLRLYPPNNGSRAAANFDRTVVDCFQWCG